MGRVLSKKKELLATGKAFTVAELLVVIAIIAILAAFSVPAVSSAMAKGRDTKCASNLKALSGAVFVFCSDNNGLFPNPSIPAVAPLEDYWHRQISRYLGATNFDAFSGRTKMANPFLCPNDPAPAFGKLSYGLNSEVLLKRQQQVTQVTAMMIADSRDWSLTPAKVKTNHAKNIQFVRLDGALGTATNLGTAASMPQNWKISK